MILATLLENAPAAAESAEGGLGGPFAIEPGLIIWTWVVFLSLFFLLRKYAWPPIVRLTEEREKLIKHQLEEAKQANTQASEALEEHKKLLAGAKGEAHQLINEAKAVAQKEREQLLAKARDEQQQVLDRAKREIEVEREKAVMQLRREAVDLSLAAASKLIQQRLDSDADRKIVEEYLDAIERSAE
jgi:F-type H+-transporting ATPase subunit b